MSSEKKHVLIIDDSPEDIQFVMENLKDDYAVLVGTSGEKGLEIAAGAPQPEVILMDVTMPGMDGYEVCRRLKDDPNTQGIDVIFVSAHDTTEEKLAGYDAGGIDYLNKPVQPKELVQKVKLAIASRAQRQQFASDKEMAFSTAMTAMTNAGELGVVLEFFRQSFSADNPENLGRMIVASISQYELECIVQMYSNPNAIHLGSREPIPPLEKELLERLKDGGRIIEYKQRAIFNFSNVSLLIKCMPEDQDKRGRLRDHIAILLEGAESKLTELNMKQNLAQLVLDSNEILQDIQHAQEKHKEASMQMMDEMLKNLEVSFLSEGWGMGDGRGTRESINDSCRKNR